jgi:hypothetical protein
MWVAIYEYDAQGEDELHLRKGDMIEVLSMDYRISGDDGWWTGKCNGKVGVFPYNFVAPLDQVRSRSHHRCIHNHNATSQSYDFLIYSYNASVVVG